MNEEHAAAGDDHDDCNANKNAFLTRNKGRISPAKCLPVRRHRKASSATATIAPNIWSACWSLLTGCATMGLTPPLTGMRRPRARAGPRGWRIRSGIQILSSQYALRPICDESREKKNPAGDMGWGGKAF